jgi:hypothetical protein
MRNFLLASLRAILKVLALAEFLFLLTMGYVAWLHSQDPLAPYYVTWRGLRFLVRRDYSPKKDERPHWTDLKLHLDLAAPITRDGLVVEATVENVSNQNFAWDKEFGQHIYWHTDADGKPLDCVEIGDTWNQLDPAEKRYVQVAPGQKLTKRIDLTKRFGHEKIVHFYYGTRGPGDPPPPRLRPDPLTDGEKILRYELPAEFRQLRISFDYQKWPFAWPVADLSGRPYPRMPGAVMPWPASNVLNIELKD